MKDYGKQAKRVLLAILIICISLPLFAFARNDTFVELPARTAVSGNIIISIPFDEPVSAVTVNRSNIYVTDGSGSKVQISRELGKDGKSILISPLVSYKPGETYTLYIRKAVSYTSGKTLNDGIKLNFTIAKAVDILPKVGTEEKLQKILKETVTANNYYNYGVKKRAGIPIFNEAAKAIDGAAVQAASAAPDQAEQYSTTNVQVKGVDEADIVKTDGKYIYQVNGNRIVAAEAYPADKMKIRKIIDLEKEQMYPVEIYLDEKYLTVIGISNMDIPVYKPEEKPLMPGFHYYNSNETVKLLIYDITNKDEIKKLREIELEGNYLSSRKIGSKIYLISNKYIGYCHRPFYRDSAVKEEPVEIDYDKISYFPDSIELSYMIAAGLDLDAPAEGVNVSTYLGSGQSVYASEQNLYVAVTKNNIVPINGKDPVIYDSAAPKTTVMSFPDRETVVYRFALNNGKLDYTGKGKVQGSILNQFSMDENEGFFRIATTKGEVWRTDENTSKNNLYILDPDLNIHGKLEDIAPGEKIYSVRFMGDRAYMVTYKKVDPLFVIDLKDAGKPRILGKLKIPGYSDYLHPYDENHIIGFGKDSVEVVHKDQSGNITGSTAYYLGMKMAIFDVTDVQNPKEEFKETIGDRGTDSELLRNHKALLFSKDKNLLAFPITVAEVQGQKKNEENGMPVYGSFTFQGAYIYNIDLENGFKLKGKISHISEEEYSKAGDYWYDSNKNIDRIIYIGDNIYTLSGGMIKAIGISDMKEKGSLLIP
ncbi:MAG: beta-propeller domain-containing protein [Caulobacteraceae bacterium]